MAITRKISAQLIFTDQKNSSTSHTNEDRHLMYSSDGLSRLVGEPRGPGCGCWLRHYQKKTCSQGQRLKIIVWFGDTGSSMNIVTPLVGQKTPGVLEKSKKLSLSMTSLPAWDVAWPTNVVLPSTTGSSAIAVVPAAKANTTVEINKCFIVSTRYCGSWKGTHYSCPLDPLPCFWKAKSRWHTNFASPWTGAPKAGIMSLERRRVFAAKSKGVFALSLRHLGEPFVV